MATKKRKKYSNPPPVEIDSVSITNGIEAALKLIEEYGVVVPEPNAVRKYLMNHGALKQFALLACCKASAGFGANSQLSLELYSDRECDDRYLVLYIRQQKYDKDIIGAIDEISESFLDYLPTKDDGYILITTDFCPPK